MYELNISVFKKAPDKLLHSSRPSQEIRTVLL
nr:MAG TPA: hypothetical protein [Caudoviricetes sp.]